MSEEAHAPGPWTATFSFPGLTPGIGDTWQIDCEGHAVCTTQFCYAPNTEANARLIAAAPCLLEALSALVDIDLSYVGSTIVIPASSHGEAIGLVSKARAAIAKATGEAQ